MRDSITNESGGNKYGEEDKNNDTDNDFISFVGSHEFVCIYLHVNEILIRDCFQRIVNIWIGYMNLCMIAFVDCICIMNGYI